MMRCRFDAWFVPPSSTSLLSDDAVSHLTRLVPTDEAVWTPCIGQTVEFAYKRCTLMRAPSDDATMRHVLSAISSAYDVDTTLLAQHGLPVIRYLPGGSAVGVVRSGLERDAKYARR